MDKYDTVKVIGSGTFGYVWLVKSTLSRQSYVVKEINMNSLNQAEQKQALNEAEVLAQLKHRNIIRHREAWIDLNGYLKIVMEYAEGGDLYTAIMNQKGVHFTEHRILTWFIQICLALQYIHSKNILHRDLKSQNIFLSRNKVIKVGDFGIARLLQGPEELAKTAIGTPYYLSPEIFERKPYNYKSDMWALGCVLFEMTALVHAFKANDFFQLANSVLNGQRQKLPSNCSLIIKEVVDELLKINPEERPSTVEVLENPALQPYLSEYMASQSTRDNFLPVLTGKTEKSTRRSSTEDGAFRISNGKFIKRRNVISGISMLKRANTLTNEKEKSGMSNNRPPASKKCDKPHPSVSSKEQKCKLERKASNQTYSFKPDKTAKSEFFVSCDTYVILPSDPELHIRESEFTRSDESMNGYYDSGFDTALRGLANVKVDDKSCNNNYIYCKDSTTLASADVQSMQDTSSTLVADGDDVFSSNDSKHDFTNLSFEFPTNHCTHSQCHKCMLDTLWKNRIRNTVGSVDKDEYYRLKNKLLRVYKERLFEKVHRSLIRCWDGTEGPTSEKKFQEIMHSLNYDQVQSLPLMVQLIQLELLKKSKT